MIRSMLAFYILNILVLATGMATTFAPLTIQEKVKHSDAVVLGTVISSHFKKDKNMIVTEVILDVKESTGLQFNQIVSRKSFKVRYPGGKWGGLVHKIEGVPEFKKGEEVVLLLRYDRNAFWIHHLAAGKFSKIIRGDEEFLISSIFSKRMGIGLISFSNFEQILKKSHLKSSLSYLPSEEKVVITKGKKKDNQKLITMRNSRHIQSKSVEDLQSSTSIFNFSFLILILALVGFLYIFILKHKKDK